MSLDIPFNRTCDMAISQQLSAPTSLRSSPIAVTLQLQIPEQQGQPLASCPVVGSVSYSLARLLR